MKRMKMKKKNLLTLTVSICLFTIISLFGVSFSYSAQKTLILGELEPLTGPVAAYGIPQRNGIKMAIDEINEAGGIPVGKDTYLLKTITYDDQAKPTEAVAAMEKLIERDKVEIIVGAITSSTVLAWQPITERKKILVILGSPGVKKLTIPGNPWTLRPTRVPDDWQGVSSGRFIYKKLGVKTLAFLAARDDYNMAGMKTVTEGFEAEGGKVVGVEYLTQGDRDFYVPLTKIKKLNPQGLFVSGYVDEACLIWKQARELGLNVVKMDNAAGSREYVLKIVGKEDVEGLYLMTSLWVDALIKLGDEKALAFSKKFKTLFGAEPTVQAAIGYDIIYALAEAIKKAGSVEKEKIREAFSRISPPAKAIHRYVLHDGKILDDEGQGYTENACLQWRNGEIVFVDYF